VPLFKYVRINSETRGPKAAGLKGLYKKSPNGEDPGGKNIFGIQNIHENANVIAKNNNKFRNSNSFFLSLTHHQILK